MGTKVRLSASSGILAAFFICVPFVLLASNNSPCQQIATRDLTQPRPPAPSGLQPGDFSEDYKNACGSSISDGVTIDKGDNLALSIIDAHPEMRDGQARIVITARLKNLNVYASAEIPWEISPVVPIKTDPSDPTVRYETATIWIWMKLPGKPRGIAELNGGVNLWAQPRNSAQHLKLRPGEWADIKFSVGVACNPIEGPVCSGYLQGGTVQLTAWWYERELTHLRKECKIEDGAYTSREFESNPFDFGPSLPPKLKDSTTNLPTRPQSK